MNEPENPAVVLMGLLSHWAIESGQAPEDILDIPLLLDLIDLCDETVDGSF